MTDLEPESKNHKNDVQDVLEIYGPVGMVASTWSLLEMSIDICLCGLSGVSPQIGFCLTTQIQSIRNKLTAMEALLIFREAPIELVKTLRKYGRSLESTTRLRNRAVHDPLTTNKNATGFEFIRKYVDRKLIYNREATSTGALLALAKEINDKLVEFQSILESTMPFWPSSPKILPEPSSSTPSHHTQELKKAAKSPRRPRSSHP